MSALGIELCDAGFTAAVTNGAGGPQELRAKDSSSSAVAWPGFAYHDGDKLHFGRAAEDQWFVHPRSVANTFWSKLAHEPSTLGPVGSRMPSYSELAYHFLNAFIQQPAIAGLRPLEKVILAVPGAYLKDSATQDEKVGLLLGMASELKLPLCGIIDMATASLCDPRADGFSGNLPVIVVDVLLHQAELTLLTPGDKLERKSFLHLPQSGCSQMLKHVNAAMGNRFLRQTAFDILADGRLEQMFFRQTKDFLLSGASEYRFQINTDRRNYEMLAKYDQLMTDAAGSAAALVQGIQGFARDSGAAPNLCTIALGSRTSLMPGLDARIRSAGFTRLIRLPSSAGAAGAAAIAAKHLSVPADLGDIQVLRSAPGAEARRAPPARWEAHLHKASFAGTKQAPTHIVLDGAGHTLSAGGRFTVGSSGTRSTVTLPDSFNHAEDCVLEFVRDGGRFWFLDSGATQPPLPGTVATRTSVEAGDRIRIRCGAADAELIFVSCA